MRLPAGTVIVVCGAGGCLERVIGDYGPRAGTRRIIDLYRPDFFRICGCPSSSGVTDVARSTSTDVRPAVSLRLTFGCGPVRPPAWPCEAGKER